MTFRDLAGAMAGASFSFAVALLAYSKHPEHVIKWGLSISLILFVLSLVAAALRAPWLSAWIVNSGLREDGRLAVRLVLHVHGHGSMGRHIVNLLLPQSVRLERVTVGGEATHRRHHDPWPTDSEEVDSEPATCWDETIDLVRGVYLYNFAVTPGERNALPFVLNVLDRRTNWLLPIDEVGVDHVVNFAYVRALLERSLMGVSKKANGLLLLLKRNANSLR